MYQVQDVTSGVSTLPVTVTCSCWPPVTENDKFFIHVMDYTFNSGYQ